ncbi:MAG: hypothetical protein M0R75_08285 [Dehalococcoidia bacterium]|nr:hypothetical protein [Dehalococcoidia bacterium]
MSYFVLCRAHPDWGLWRVEGLFVRDALVAQAPAFGRVLLEYEEQPHLWWQAGRTYRGMLCAVLDLSEPVIADGELVGAPSGMRDSVDFLRPRVEDLVRTALAAVGQLDDEWHRALAAGLLIEPGLAEWMRPFAPSLVPPRDPSASPWRMDLAMPGGVPLRVARASAGLALAVQRRHGVDVQAPRQQGTRAPTTTRRDFVSYVAARRSAGVSIEFITEDAEAARLYRRWKPDGVLTAKVVRTALRRASEQSR